MMMKMMMLLKSTLERDTERKKNEGQNYMSTIENESQAKKKRERKILDRTMQSLNENNNNDND